MAGLTGRFRWNRQEVSADATDDGAVAQVEFFVDGSSLGVDSDGADGWSASWNTVEVPDGDYTVEATAIDDAANSSSADADVTVNNGSESDQWARAASLGGPGRDLAVALTIGDRGYVGLGQAGTGGCCEDFWEYDPATDSWTQKASFGGGPRSSAAGFSLGDKGYVGTGFGDKQHLADFWEYDPGTNTWTRIADFGGTARRKAVAFAIGGKGYVGTGTDNCPIPDCEVEGTTGKVTDLWEYDPGADNWTRKADLPGEARFAAVGFAIGDKGYVGTGAKDGGEGRLADFWAYDPATDSWTRKADLAGEARIWAAGFSVGDRGYVASGTGGAASTVGRLRDIWAYDPATDSWSEMDLWPARGRLGPVAFAVGDRGYLGTGREGVDGEQTFARDFWAFTPPAN